jgi:cytochrome c oxidase cbb3-type subunit III
VIGFSGLRRSHVVRVRHFVQALALVAVLASTAVTAAPDPVLEKGRAVYNFRCYYCHGYSGDARTVAASFLAPPPADFSRATPDTLPEAKIVATLRDGRPGTAMKSFASVIPADEIHAVAKFVFDEFVVRKAVNTRYHTEANGWPDHERYRIAFPFATGEIPASGPWEDLSPEQVRGKRLFLESCVTCHDRGNPPDRGTAWEARPLSYPRNNFSFTVPQKVDATTSASPYALHDIPPKLKRLTKSERKGEKLFQANCAFCHAADGTGKNWIGSFLEPHPRNLRDAEFMSRITRQYFIGAVREGLPNTSMPAWKNVLSAQEIEAIADYVNRAFHPLRSATEPAKSTGKAP